MQEKRNASGGIAMSQRKYTHIKALKQESAKM